MVFSVRPEPVEGLFSFVWFYPRISRNVSDFIKTYDGQVAGQVHRIKPGPLVPSLWFDPGFAKCYAGQAHQNKSWAFNPEFIEVVTMNGGGKLFSKICNPLELDINHVIALIKNSNILKNYKKTSFYM